METKEKYTEFKSYADICKYLNIEYVRNEDASTKLMNISQALNDIYLTQHEIKQTETLDLWEREGKRDKYFYPYFVEEDGELVFAFTSQAPCLDEENEFHVKYQTKELAEYAGKYFLSSYKKYFNSKTK